MIWVLLAVIAAAVVAALLWPILRKPSGPSKDRAEYDLAVFQDQLKEVDRDVERGVLSQEEAKAARLEIQRRILAAGKAPADIQAPENRRRRMALVGGLVVLVPVVAFGIYFVVGSPNLTSSNVPTDDDITQMVDKLAARVAENPKDLESVKLLARTYRQMGQWDNAARAFEQLAALEPNADNYASYGEVMAARDNGEITKPAHDALIKALTVDRTEPRARFYLGLEQSQKGNARDAIAIWRDLLAIAPSDAPWAGMVKEQMAQVAQEASIAPMSVEPKHPFALEENAQAAAAAAAAAISAPPQAPSPPPNPLAANYSPEQLKMIEGMVANLSDRLEKSPDDYNGWMMLGRSYVVLQNMDGAAKAYEKAIALKPSEVDPKLQYVALIMTHTQPDGSAPLPAKLTATVADILKLNPQQPEALYLAGLERAKAGDAAGARDFWGKADKVLPQDAPLKADIAHRLEGLK